MKLLLRRYISIIIISTFTILIILIGGCSPKPEPINYGQDVCELCRMNITDNKFAAELITTKGKVYKFDSLECLLHYKHELIEANEIHSEWVNDFVNPGALIDLRKAFLLHSDYFKSPMGLNVLSFASKEKMNEIKERYGGKELSYDDVMKLVMEE